MSSIVSTLSGKFGKSFIMGTLLPVTAFVILAWQLLQPLTGKLDPGALNLINSQALQSDLFALALIIVFLAVLLYFLNIPLIRLYEGYPWRNTWLGRVFVDCQTKRYNHVVSRAGGYRALLYALARAGGKVFTRWTLYMQAQQNHFLMPSSDVLPTTLGNTIRSFEEYPSQQYGIDAVSLWPRLIAVVDQEYLALIDDAKISFDFMVNMSFLATLLVLSLLVAAVLFPSSLTSTRVLVAWGGELVVLTSVARVSYLLSIGQAATWGELVKSAFDTYRLDLLSHLGYDQKPARKEEERILWQLVSAQLAYGDSPVGPYPPYSWGSSATHAFGTPMLAKLELTRGLIPLRGDKFRVVLQVKNVDPAERKVTNIVVSDPVPESHAYQWGSARIQGLNAEPVGTGPLRFRIDALDPRAQVTITYCLLKV